MVQYPKFVIPGPPWKKHIVDWITDIFIYDGYEIVLMDTLNNRCIDEHDMKAEYVVSLSGGLGSAFAGERVIQRYGRKNTVLWFADVQKEDEDLYRFIHDLMKRWGGRLYYFVDGRRPEDVWEKRKLIPNDRMCPCSYELKVKHYRQFIQTLYRIPHVVIGFKADESDRQADTCASYEEAIPGIVVDYPLMWEPVDHRDLASICEEELGIIPPRLYSLSFGYNNCGGDCCRSGLGARVLESIHFPERFEKAMLWEEKMRAKGGSLEGRAFCARQTKEGKVPIPLRMVRQEYVPLVESYLQANPDTPISAKTVIRKAKSWQRKQQKAKEK